MDVSKSILRGLSEAVEYEKGNQSKATRSRVEIAELPSYHGVKIKEIRMKKKLSQAAFAKVIGVSVKTVEAWEADRNIPSGPVQRLLDMIEREENVLENSNILLLK
jgi:putative transcriptional regulator